MTFLADLDILRHFTVVFVLLWPCADDESRGWFVFTTTMGCGKDEEVWVSGV